MPENEPQPREGVPDRPGWLTVEAKREWSRLVAELQVMGVLTKIDRIELAALAQNYADYAEARRDIEEKGWEYETETGYKGNRPAVARMHKALEKIITLGAKFGISPADRVKLGTPKKEEAADPFADYLKRKNATSS